MEAKLVTTSECFNLRRTLCSVFVYERLNCTFLNSTVCVLSSSDMSSKTWLQTHGLVAKKLTITDALAGTMVPHSSTYVPILNKNVVSKVFDEVT